MNELGIAVYLEGLFQSKLMNNPRIYEHIGRRTFIEIWTYRPVKREGRIEWFN